MFSLFDTVAGVFSPPYCVAHYDLGPRGFAEAARDPSSWLHGRRETTRLYFLGEFDDETGELLPAPNRIDLGFYQEK